MTSSGPLTCGAGTPRKGKAMAGNRDLERVPFEEHLYEELKDDEFAIGYLNECLNDSEEVFLLGLRHVAEARGGVAALAQRSNLNREHLYRTLSRKGNPSMKNVGAILAAVGLNLRVGGRQAVS